MGTKTTEEWLSEADGRLALFEKNLPRQIDPIALSRSKLPFKALSYRETLIWRVTELGRAAVENFKQHRVAAATLLTRAVVETTAALWYLRKKMTAALEAAPTESTLHGFKIIGQLDLDRDLAKVVAAQFKAAIASQDGTSAGCFDPRHALTVTSRGTTYDFLLCYACGELEVFSGKRMIADFPARGTGEILNAILSANKVPLSRSAMELQDSRDTGRLRFDPMQVHGAREP